MKCLLIVCTAALFVSCTGNDLRSPPIDIETRTPDAGDGGSTDVEPADLTPDTHLKDADEVDLVDDSALSENLDLGPCSENLELIVTADQDGYRRVFAKVKQDGKDVALLFDTGSQLTFLSAPNLPDGTPDVGEIDFGCGPRSLVGRPFPLEGESREAASEVVGVLGADFFHESVTRVDLDGKFTQRIELEDVSQDTQIMPFQNVFGYIFVDVTIDGDDLLLGFDTGASHSLRVGVDGKPGDIAIPSMDGFGNPITYFLGTADFQFDEVVFEAPILRILEQESIQQTDGLFGLTSLRSPQFVIDGPNTTILFEF